MAEKKAFKSFTALTESINAGIADVSTNKTALDKVIQKRVDAEIEKRSVLLEKGFDKYNEAVKALNKIGPDVITHTLAGESNEGGTPVTNKAYSDKQLKLLQQTRKAVSDLDVAFIKAFEEGNYEPLTKLVAGGGGKPENADAKE
jgi:hypothetical protein